MKLEIERKFLVLNNDFKKDTTLKTRIAQKYLSSNPERTVRIRIKEDLGFITIKGIGNKTGMTRYEWEREISYKEALELQSICEPGGIDKIRYLVKYGRHAYEVDEYIGENEGLIVAEIELSREDETFSKPTWLGKEVTGIKKYYNSMLMKEPYSTWESK